MNGFIRRVIILTSFFTLYSLHLLADDPLTIETGAKVIVSDDENGNQRYYKYFASTEYEFTLASASLGFTRWQSYLLTDENYNEKEISINQAEIGSCIYPNDLFLFDLSYSLLSGESSYLSHKFYGAVSLYAGDATASASCTLKKTTYNFDGTIETVKTNADASLSYELNALLDIDAGYTYERTDYRTYGYVYQNNIVRTGIMIIPRNAFFLFAGLSAGKDSDSTTSLALDAGFSITFMERVKLKAAYIGTEYSYRSTSVSSRGRRSGGTSTTSSSTEFEHTGNVSLSLLW